MVIRMLEKCLMEGEIHGKQKFSKNFLKRSEKFRESRRLSEKQCQNVFFFKFPKTLFLQIFIRLLVESENFCRFSLDFDCELFCRFSLDFDCELFITPVCLLSYKISRLRSLGMKITSSVTGPY